MHFDHNNQEIQEISVEKETAEHKILHTAITLLGMEGLKRFTIRRVAERSGVNVAAINYYFRSKDNLIKEALQHYSQLTQKVFAVLQDESLTPFDRLHTFLTRFAMHLVTYPGFMKSILIQAMNKEDIDPRAKESMIRGREALFHLLQTAGVPSGVTPEDADAQLRMKIFQMMAGIIYPVMWGTYTKELYLIDFENPTVRERYINMLLHNLFPELGGAQSRPTIEG